MPIAVGDLIARRPFFYHLTARGNLPRIQRDGRLVCANAFFRQANRVDLATVRRRHHCVLEVVGELVHIRDQAPLHEGNMKLEGGWDYQRFVREINDLVFFWPGDERAPIPYGRRHFARYADEDVRILRVSTADLLAANQRCEALVCRYNSGSPRWSRGRPSPRGPATFVTLNQAVFPVNSVVEVTFRSEVILPPSTTVSWSLAGPWRTL